MLGMAKTCAGLLLLCGVLTSCAALRTGSSPIAPDETGFFMVTLASRPGVEQRIYIRKPQDPVASVVLFTGDAGIVSETRENFLLRSERLFVEEGFMTAVFDVPSDRHTLNYGFRVSPEHATDIRAAIQYLRQSAKSPVWLIGTSAGTPSAVTGGALSEGGPDGIVVSSSIVDNRSRLSSVWDADWRHVAVPILVVHHEEDGCPITSFAGIKQFVAALKQSGSAPNVELLSYTGGSVASSGPCQAWSRHGYIGIERQVVNDIGSRIKASIRPDPGGQSSSPSP